MMKLLKSWSETCPWSLPVRCHTPTPSTAVLCLALMDEWLACLYWIASWDCSFKLHACMSNCLFDSSTQMFQGTSNAMWPKQMSCVPLEYLFSQHFLFVSDSTNHPITQGTDSWDILKVFLCFIPKSSPSPVLLDFIFWVPYQSIYFHPHRLPPLSLTFPCLSSQFCSDLWISCLLALSDGFCMLHQSHLLKMQNLSCHLPGPSAWIPTALRKKRHRPQGPVGFLFCIVLHLSLHSYEPSLTNRRLVSFPVASFPHFL